MRAFIFENSGVTIFAKKSIKISHFPSVQLSPDSTGKPYQTRPTLGFSCIRARKILQPCSRALSRDFVPRSLTCYYCNVHGFHNHPHTAACLKIPCALGKNCARALFRRVSQCSMACTQIPPRLSSPTAAVGPSAIQSAHLQHGWKKDADIREIQRKTRGARAHFEEVVLAFKSALFC